MQAKTRSLCELKSAYIALCQRNKLIWKPLCGVIALRVYQNAHETNGRDIFLYLSAKQLLIINMLRADKYKNMSLP